MQFGPGTQLAAQCSPAPAPDGWRPWLPESDGPLPDALATRAAAFAAYEATPLGATESFPLPGVTALIRVEARVWGRDANGMLTPGCFKAGAVYVPDNKLETVTTPAERSSTEKVIGVLTVLSLAVGTTATLISWGK